MTAALRAAAGYRWLVFKRCTWELRRQRVEATHYRESAQSSTFLKSEPTEGYIPTKKEETEKHHPSKEKQSKTLSFQALAVNSGRKKFSLNIYNYKHAS